MSVQLPSDIYSPDQIGIVLWELTSLISRLQDASTRATVVKDGAPQQEIHISAMLLGVLHAASVSAADRKALEVLARELQTIRDHALVAHMVLPELPNRTLKRQLVEWFRGEIHPQLLLTFAVRHDIGGGFLLRVGSRQYDFTFRSRLLENKHRVVEIFDSVRQ